MNTSQFFRAIGILLFTLLFNVASAQTLTLNEIISAPRITADNTDDLLKQKGWEQYSYEINKDSGFVKRVWMIKNHYNDLKSYYTYYQSDVDSSENHITYQFSDRETFLSYQSNLKNKGYKLLPEKKKKGKKKKDKNKTKDKEYIYVNEKNNSLVSLKEVFMLGLNAFLTDSYQYKSQMAKRILEEK